MICFLFWISWNLIAGFYSIPLSLCTSLAFFLLSLPLSFFYFSHFLFEGMMAHSVSRFTGQRHLIGGASLLILFLILMSWYVLIL